MRFSQQVAARQSCRHYDPSRPVSREQLQQIIEVARLAPSACNSQPWHLTAVCSQPTVQQIAAATQSLGLNKFTNNCPAFIVINEETATLRQEIAGRIKNQHYAGYDIGIVAAHCCYAAQELGLSTCIIGWFDADGVRAACGLENGKRIALLLAVGYAAADDTLRTKRRKQLDEMATIIG